MKLFSHRIANNAAFGALQTLSSAVLMFFLYRFLLKNLGAENLGIWAVVLASTSIGRLTDLGFAGAVVKFVAGSQAEQDSARAARYVQTAAISIASILFVLGLCLLPVFDFLLTWVLPAAAQPLAVQILPFALLTLFFSLVAGIFQSAIDACHRMDRRNAILMGCNVLYTAVAVLATPVYGLKGLAFAQVTQSFLVLAMSWFSARKLIPEIPVLLLKWNHTEFKEMLGYATNFQIGVLAGLFFDPITKFFLAKFGGLAEVAYYEMANQLILRARGVVVSAQQAIVPEVASQVAEGKDDSAGLYLKAHRLSLVIVFPYYSLLAISLPAFSMFWIGHYEPKFVIYGALMCMGWLISNLGVASYYYNIGRGMLVWNTISHLLMAVVNIVFAVILGYFFDGIGVIVAAMLGLIFSGVLLTMVVHHKLGMQMKSILPREHFLYVGILVLGLASLLMVLTVTDVTANVGKLTLLVLPVLYMGIIVCAMRGDSKGREFMSTLRAKFSRG
ncbi:oligosaccharide flippase family protein [Roseateles koreensis]|uniref:Oligosaccharide flippase family protein n=1 Tax=Roseateles koreensis TaxID=2987526 RepID=A0ABT5KWA4_9BURK|nr:oligosaccharide flippase family protein [Roseateles koreensis]MDC8786695.1 oligosaccharide flippase family protein [Roseateles koreensis]